MNREGITKKETEYLVTVYRIAGGRPDKTVGPSELARAAGIKRPSALEILYKLEALGFGTYFPRKGFLINSEGILLVEEHLRKHRVLEAYLVEFLGVSREEVCHEAACLDYQVSDKIIERMDEILGRPDVCPCGNVIPRMKGHNKKDPEVVV